jgi:tetratricopeptide (TPR) repeat protein
MRARQTLHLRWLVCALLANTAYIASSAAPTIFYMGNVLLHVVLGAVVSVEAARVLYRDRTIAREFRGALVLGAVAAALGGYLVVVGNTRPHRSLLYAHIVAAAAAVVALLLSLWRKARTDEGWRPARAAIAVAAAACVVGPAVSEGWRRANPDPHARIVNSVDVPLSMEEEGEGPKSVFWPSSARTNVGGIIPSNFFMDSQRCGDCHKDIYKQWNSSAHHFASFNNQFYRKSIEYMQDVVGTQPSRWCAGCHDHAVFFNGRFERPIKEQLDTPEAHAGLACTSCHAITQVHGTTGQGNFTIEYPPLHEIATSRNPVIRQLDDFLTYLDPKPHRDTFMKPFMRLDSAQFCSACHKVHLDIPVNQYRWFRGFNDYDAWQASGVSGEGARSFYYPKESKTCAGCHMPLVPSNDPGNVNGKVHNHRFAAANTAVAHVNGDKEQLEAVVRNLTSGIVTVDIFAASPVRETATVTAMPRRSDPSGPQLSSTFAVGEEAEEQGEVVLREVSNLAAPLDRVGLKVRPGSLVRVDVVARTRGMGHFFPGGTVDAFDVWLELIARDADERVIFWSGRAADEGRGAVDPGAHFYRSLLLDAEGNPINKRNAWQARSVLYSRLIPPGAADVAHFRVRVPKDARGPISLTAKLNYRKFSHYYTQFAYAGEPKPGQPPSLLQAGFNSLDYSFDPVHIPRNVSGQIKDRIPDLPTIVVASAKAQLGVDAAATDDGWKPKLMAEDYERWNDWGIGTFLQGDLRAAQYAFKHVTEVKPDYVDGWVNVARVLVREGENAAAKPYLERALSMVPGLPRAHFFQAMVHKTEGQYGRALQSIDTVLRAHPRDRVALNQKARLQFLEKDFKGALKTLEQVAGVDPEDVQMHYLAMLCHRGLGDKEKAERAGKLFRRFKADETSQAITARRRMLSPEDNNERQAIHDHDSVPLEDREGVRSAAR